MLAEAEERDQLWIKGLHKKPRGESLSSFGNQWKKAKDQPGSDLSPLLAVGAYQALPQVDTSVGTSIVRGIFPVFSSWARVLIDMGASHLFISASFGHSLGLEVMQRDSFLCVDTPVGGPVSLDRICQGCAIKIAGRTLEFDFVIFNMTGFDVILGINWLSFFCAMIDYFHGRVSVYTPMGDYFHFVGDRSDSHSIMIFSIGD
ncbi:uncharacterized protein LOC132296576 [Cornus florida]|uniref:uncharacterized protein LOC132296576 n=1 Tax=Cornus florida TaxID=4283 RepID=UPI00289650DD|nr:uncharacterized protein LOC132296576 [Cornus florida]